MRGPFTPGPRCAAPPAPVVVTALAMSVIFLKDLQRNAVHNFIKAKMCEIGWSCRGERFALSWFPYKPYTLFTCNCTVYSKCGFFFVCVYWYHGLLKNTARFLTLSRPKLTGRLLFRCIENCSEQTSITKNTRLLILFIFHCITKLSPKDNKLQQYLLILTSFSY